MALCVQPWFIVILLIPSGTICDNSKPKPVIKDCGANYDGSHHQISLSWDKNNINIRVKHYQITFNCSDFYKKMNTPTPFHYSYSFTVSLDTCYDQCSCTVRAIARYDNNLNTTDRSDECRIDIGPAVPRAAPVISTPVRRVDDERLVLVYFTLPSLKRFYCDGDIVRSVTVLVQHYNESFEYYIDDHVKTNDKYKLVLSFNNNYSSYFRRILNISLSVNNTKGASPLSNPYTLREFVYKNSDIAPSDYHLDYANTTDTSVLLYWTFKPVINDMIKNNFITTLHYLLEYTNDTSRTVDIIRNFTSLNTTLVLHDLSPQQWYFVTVRLVTTDHETHGPWPLKIRFLTLERILNNTGTTYHKQPDDDGSKSVLVFVFSGIILVIIGIVILTVCIRPLCHKTTCTSSCLKMTESSGETASVSGISTHITSIPMPPDSNVERLSQSALSTGGDTVGGEYITIKDIT